MNQAGDDYGIFTKNEIKFARANRNAYHSGSIN